MFKIYFYYKEQNKIIKEVIEVNDNSLICSTSYLNCYYENTMSYKKKS